jgi:hypothetical protein
VLTQLPPVDPAALPRRAPHDPVPLPSAVLPPVPSRRIRLLPALLVCILLGAAAAVVVPRGLDAQSLLAIEDDPARLADRALDGHFDRAIAEQNMQAALAANDADLAKSFLDLARDRQVEIDAALAAKVEAAAAEEQSTQHALKSFAMGFVSGEPNDAASLAGTATGDLMVFGDIRDAVREGSRLAIGEKADELVLGLACVGLAITAGTYATLGAATPVRAGVSLAKAARKTGALGADMAAYIGRMLRHVVDWDKLKGAVTGFSVAQPAAAVRAARAAVKVERAGGLVRLVRDVGRVESKAGARAALDGLKVAETPREMSRLARLAEKKGGKTRAILKIAGRGAIMLTVAAFDLGVWILGALLTVFGFVSSLKSMTERMTQRALDRAKMRRLHAQARFAAMTVRG